MWFKLMLLILLFQNLLYAWGKIRVGVHEEVIFLLSGHF